jgi:hypothetical protein
VPCLDDRGVASSPPLARTHGLDPPGAPNREARLRPESLLRRMFALLALRPEHLLVQIGCASPEYLLATAELVPLRYQALVVDASPERLAPFLGTPKLRPVAMEPLRFAAYPMQCDRILLEDGVLGGDPGAELARGLFRRLRPTGRLLVVGAAPRPELPAGERRALPAPRGMRAQGSSGRWKLPGSR